MSFALGERVCERLGVLDDLRLIILVFGRVRLFERDGFSRYYMLERTALRAGKHRFINRFGILLSAQYHAATRTSQRLMRSSRHNVGILDGIGMNARRDKPRDVRHIDHEHRAHLVRDLAETLKVYYARICRRARQNKFWLAFSRYAFDLGIVYCLGLFVYAVRNYVVKPARIIDLRAVRQMPAVREVHAHERIAGIEHRVKHRVIGVRPAWG